MLLNRSGVLPPETSVSWTFSVNLRPQLSFQRREKFPVACSGICNPASWLGGTWDCNETSFKKISMPGLCYGGIWCLNSSSTQTLAAITVPLVKNPAVLLLLTKHETIRNLFQYILNIMYTLHFLLVFIKFICSNIYIPPFFLVQGITSDP